MTDGHYDPEMLAHLEDPLIPAPEAKMKTPSRTRNAAQLATILRKYRERLRENPDPNGLWMDMRLAQNLLAAAEIAEYQARLIEKHGISLEDTGAIIRRAHFDPRIDEGAQ